MEFKPTEKEEIKEEEISKLPSNLSYLRWLPVQAHEIFRNVIFAADPRSISAICEDFHEDINIRVREACNPRFWGSILLSETNKTQDEIIKYLKTNPTPLEIKEYYYNNFILNKKFLENTYKFYVSFFPIREEIIITSNLKENHKMKALEQNTLFGWNKIIEKKDFILLSSPGIVEVKFVKNNHLIFELSNQILLSNLKDSQNIHNRRKKNQIIIDFMGTNYKIIFFAVKPEYIQKDEFDNEMVKSENIIILTDTGNIDFLIAKKKAGQGSEILRPEYTLGENPFNNKKEIYVKGKFDTLWINDVGHITMISENDQLKLNDNTKFQAFQIPDLITAISIWNDIAEDMSKIRKDNWDKLRDILPDEPFPSKKTANSFEVKYILGESIGNSKFAIIFDKISQKASIWNCDLNKFYCDHKHNLEDLKNWIEFKKEKNDDICPNCCN